MPHTCVTVFADDDGDVKTHGAGFREHSVAIERDRAQLALLVGETNSKNSTLREKVNRR